ncbi:MAG: carboxypeptidase regulatory-like domain-containing protein [Planctomycetota bacterium]
MTRFSRRRTLVTLALLAGLTALLVVLLQQGQSSQRQRVSRMPELNAGTGDAHLSELTREPVPRSLADSGAPPWSAGSLAGRVVDADGHPVPEARVAIVPSVPGAEITENYLEEVQDSYADQMMGFLDAHHDEMQQVLQPTQTDGHGRFRLDGLPSECRYMLEVTRVGYAHAREWHVGVHPAQVNDIGDLPIFPELSLRGLVVDPQGNHVGKVCVQVVIECFHGKYEKEELTAENGRFSIGELPEGHAVVSVKKEGMVLWPPVETHFDLRYGELLPEPLFALWPSAPVSGVVIDEEDAPVAGVTVSATWPLLGDTGYAYPDTQSAADGRFVISAVPSGSVVNVRAWVDGRPSARIEGVPAGASDLRLVVRSLSGSHASLRETPSEGHRAAKIEGVVARAGTGERVAGAYIELLKPLPPGDFHATYRFGVRMRDDLQRTAITRSRADGVFEFERVEPGEYEIRATASGLASTQRSGIEIVPGWEEVTVTIEIGSGGYVEGRVFEVDGTPARDVPVVAFRLDGVRGETWSDTRGSYRIGPLESGGYRVEAGDVHAGPYSSMMGGNVGAPRQDATDYPVAVLQGQTTPLDIVRGLGPGRAALSGTVRVDGRLAGGFLVLLSGLERDFMSRNFADLVARDGSFEILNVVPGRYSLSLGNTGDDFPLERRTIELVAGSAATLDLNLRSASLEIEVVDAIDGRPLPAGLQIDSGEDWAGKETAKDGTCLVQRLGPGVYVIEVGCEGYAREVTTVEVAGGCRERLRLDLPRCGRARLRFEGLTAALPEDLELEAAMNGHTYCVELTPEEGSCLVHGLPVGDCELRMRWGREDERTVPIRVEVDEIVEVVVDLGQ